MRLELNGTSTEVPDDLTVAVLVAQRADPDQRVAVAVNGEVVPRSAWEESSLKHGDVVEVLTAVAGG